MALGLPTKKRDKDWTPDSGRAPDLVKPAKKKKPKKTASKAKAPKGESALAKKWASIFRREKEHRYTYTAKDRDGKEVKGKITARAQHAAFASLQADGFTEISMSESRRILTAQISKKKADPEELVAFSRQLAVFVRAGVPLTAALMVMAREAHDKVMRAVSDDLVNLIRQGTPLSVAMKGHPEAFSELYVAAVQSAELTGRLDDTLEQMAEFINREVKTRQRIKSAMMYPTIVGIMGMVTIAVLSVYVLPKFVTFFKSFNAKLPLPTVMLMSGSSWLTANGVYLLIVVALLVVGVIMARRTPRGRLIWDTILLNLPVTGKIVEAAVLERITRIMSAMLRAGIDLPKTMRIASDTARNRVFKDAILQALDKVQGGSGLSESIGETGRFSGTAQQMFQVGEQTGTLDYQLEVAADYYSNETDVMVEKATGMLEPLVLIVVGAIVGFVAIAMVSAMYGIFNQVKTG